MKSMDLVLEMRRRGLRPKAVFIDLVDKPSIAVDPLSRHGIVTLEILASEPISAFDFRPLTGLAVHVYDQVGDPYRQRKVASAVVEVEPSLLVVAMPEGATWTIHRRFSGNPETTDRTTL